MLLTYALCKIPRRGKPQKVRLYATPFGNPGLPHTEFARVPRFSFAGPRLVDYWIVHAFRLVGDRANLFDFHLPMVFEKMAKSKSIKPNWGLLNATVGDCFDAGFDRALICQHPICKYRSMQDIRPWVAGQIAIIKQAVVQYETGSRHLPAFVSP